MMKTFAFELCQQNQIMALVFSVVYAVVVIIVYALVVTDVVVILNAVAVIVVRVVMNSLWSPSITVLPSTGQNRCNGNIFSSRHL